MGAFLSYSIYSGIILLALYLAFRFTMTNEKQFAYNRGILLSIYAISFLAAPIADIIMKLMPHNEAVATLVPSEIDINIGKSSHPIWGTILIWVYIAGMVVMGFKTLITWHRIITIISSGERIKRNGYTLILIDNKRIAPFSWMHYMVTNHADYDLCGDAITAHELRHIRLYHRIDLLIAQAVVVINWFNPAAWLMREELMLIHEYQADMAVINSGVDPKQYQMLLIEKAVGARFPSLANSLNHSKLKKRITMMYEEKSGKGRKIIALALVPAFALALAATSIPQVQAAMSTISNSATSVSKDTNNPANSEITAKNFALKSVSNVGGVTTIELSCTGIEGSLAISDAVFNTNGKSYNANELSCNRTADSAIITAKFPFLTAFVDVTMDITVNGAPMTIDFGPFFSQRR